MRDVTMSSNPIREIENEWIVLADGTRLAARIWMPTDAAAHPVPAVLEYIPYRKRDFTRARDALIHPWFGAHGFASVRVDIRGSGDSDGVLSDEYLPLELDDAVEVIAWLARQPWCSGSVGMMGNSWGGFNALQVAARRPPALKAIITSCSTDDRYADDIHYMGGCLLNDNMKWGASMFSHNSRPPDPALVGERWRAMWLQRLEGSGLWIDSWLRHQRRDAFWKHGSVCEDFPAIRIPVFAVGGWNDGYRNAIPRLLSGLDVPRMAWIGQWAHRYPHMAAPGPGVGFLQEAKRWWDHWLKGQDTGLMNGPMLRAYMQDPVPPLAHLDADSRALGRRARLAERGDFAQAHVPEQRRARRCRWRRKAVWASARRRTSGCSRGTGAATASARDCRPTSAWTMPARWCSTRRRWSGASSCWAHRWSNSNCRRTEPQAMVAVRLNVRGARWRGHARELRPAQPDAP